MQVIRYLAICVCIVFVVAPAMADDDKIPDTLMIERVEVEKGAKAAVKINFVNDQELAALTIPLGLVGGYTIDSVSFVGSRVEYLKTRPITIAENRKEVVFGAICMTEDYIPVGRGLMATLYLSPEKEVALGGCKVDTTTIGPASVLFTKTNSASFVPKFQFGEITMKKAVQQETADKESSDSTSSGDDE